LAFAKASYDGSIGVGADANSLVQAVVLVGGYARARAQACFAFASEAVISSKHTGTAQATVPHSPTLGPRPCFAYPALIIWQGVLSRYTL